MAGDFNMVELYEDSKGKSALVSGAEARSWKYVAESKGLVDAYLCAVTTTGGFFTRQAFCGLRYDRARLNRIYVSEGAEWLELVKEVSHKSDQVVSDQVPVTFDCRLKSDGDQGRRSPTRYFYAQANAKFSREAIQALKLEDGTTTIDRTKIMEEVGDYYIKIFQREETTATIIAAREEAFVVLSKKVTAQQDERVSQHPTLDEVEKFVSMLQRDKSPGLDGLTVEALLLSWDRVKDDCFSMIQHFWDTGELIQGSRTAVIKLLPKNQDKEELKKWRPLSLMLLTYKIIAKLVAERMKKYMMPELVDMQQVGFIQGRSITTNLLSLRLGKDWAAATGRNAFS
ncbi:hypothetical protein R1sor_027014 [Riccia sorocarpa]|uniref:Reverse transcriptase domain-containing protein n=1 Tax=Riccia sorocarpa TaxID=122646 RepID=A0ABD3GGQ2_9MARC